MYCAAHVLCEHCGQLEEEAIEVAGTNDLPDLLASYGNPNFPP